MDQLQHALAVLQQGNEVWDWPITKRMQETVTGSKNPYSKFRAIAPTFLYHLISESQELGGQVLDQFWEQLGACDAKLRENISCLKKEKFVSAERSVEVLSRGLDLKRVNYQPVLNMATEYFTHLGVAMMNPGGKRSGSATVYSVSEDISKETCDLLLETRNDESFGTRKQEVLKELAFRRDGHTCLLTDWAFRPFDPEGAYHELAHIIPFPMHTKDPTFKCMSTFAGVDAAHDIANNLNGIGNAMNLELHSHASYDDLEWGIEAKEEDGKVKYRFRRVPINPNRGPKPIALKDGQEIQFGKGLEGEDIDRPIPRLCNIRLAVARIMRLSGAADIILEWKQQVDDAGGGPLFVESEEYCVVLDAKLFLAGGSLVW